MNDIALSSLLNLFALFGAENNIDKEQALALVSNYLVNAFGIRNPKSYLNLYADLRGFYDEFSDIDKEEIISGICAKLKGKITRADQGGMVLRLLEFCNTNKSQFDVNNHIIRKVAEEFEISDNTYTKYTDFILGIPSDNVLVLPLDNNAGTLKTLWLKAHNTLLFSYIGTKTVLMNDIPVTSGIYQLWQQSGVLKSRHFSPVYYSSIIRMYNKEDVKNEVELCGRDINFRFAKGGDNGMHNFSFTLHSGQLVAIMGGSGVGKSTLLSLLNGSLAPQEGSITINGHSISEPEAKALIGFVPQDDLLIEELTVYQNLWYTAKLCFDQMPDDILNEKVMSVLKQLGLDQAKDLKVGSPINKYISGGQRKRLNIALELIREPAILFLDEPTSGLSSSDTEKVIDLLKEQTDKGKLIITNIHQPSSDVFKLFDRLWLLDKGGYPIYDGNPIDAISYFKMAANYADAETSACPTCGNVNPELILNIIDEKAIDTTGHLSEKRRISPQDWHELYLKNRPDMAPVESVEIPANDQKRPGKLRQTLIFLKRTVSSKITNLQYMMVTLLEAPLLAFICALLTHYIPDSGVYSVMDNKNLVSYFFMAIIVSIFLGMSGSAEEIIKDRALLKREKFLSLSYGSYIQSKIIYMAGVCLIQTLLFILVGNTIMQIHGLFWTWWLILFISAFTASLTGLLLSQIMNSVVAIYITIPILLIPQILLCGLVVHFDDLNPNSESGNVPIIGDFIPSRWAYEALAVSNFKQNKYEKILYDQDKSRYEAIYYERAFAYELESQLETRLDEMNKGLPENPRHLAVIRTELPKLTEMCGLEPYSGDESYESLMDYINRAKQALSHIGNVTALAYDRKVSEYIKENSLEELQNLKRDNYNIQLENLVLNRTTNKLYSVIGNHIVPRCGYIFLKPQSKVGRAPFYSGVKILGSREIYTLWFNMGILLLMCVVLCIMLVKDFPGKLIRRE
ncbi:MAG: ATP-binding cassette domain-containing protein [Bacteroidales bacterium]|nr:ATP-binding cassette domain-containing protein [Bacteroidales bacterium]